MSSTSPLPSINSDLIRALADVLDETRLTEIEYEASGIKIRVARQTHTVSAQYHPPAPLASSSGQPAAPAHHEEAVSANAVTSPMVGVVYLSPDPSSPRFADVGSTVHEGQTLLLIEAMKTFNPIQAPRGGKRHPHPGRPTASRWNSANRW